ncbi:MAG: DUF2306 domain-containing protein [Alphaproteobacteria bacterium]|nr:DUF2306 domain-containing protein [Alphaproteobacteria bacterium]
MATKPDTWPTAAFWMAFVGRLLLGLLLVFAILGAWLAAMPAGKRDAIIGYWFSVKVTALSFDAAPLLAAPASVQIHVAAALVAMAVGAVILLLPKGTGFHRTLGWIWVASMIIVAATSIMMIFDFRTGVNPLHAFTALTVISLWAGLTGIRRGNVQRHAGSMVGLYIGGLFIAAAFAFIPGRTMWQVFFDG